ncbi:methylated-DNA--[protein]-cysteine S-methyltransferase [Acidipropionibacterium jensenii]|uniref:methylated-DNA--[protein]-cysteine S-methyltransferase n=1 Tax=Acidipropionibacterium jensenii TaxID=1749 RepID=UPI0026472B2B|nr:methylated-DNA--[protein]-cysteine S-methyltransferase [Acidipropionibacterium jensenii]
MVSAGTEALEASYRILQPPIGALLVASTGRGLVRIAFDNEDFDDVLDTLSRTLGAGLSQNPERLEDAARQIDEYLTGGRRTFDLTVDPTVLVGFRGAVQADLPAIAYGTTATYSEVAARLGRPRAVRAVGSACATNPVPLVLPCHRVVRSDGQLGGYRGGLATKAFLIALEADTAR